MNNDKNNNILVLTLWLWCYGLTTAHDWRQFLLVGWYQCAPTDGAGQSASRRSVTNSLRWSRSINLVTIVLSHTSSTVRYRSTPDMAICQRLKLAGEVCSVLYECQSAALCVITCLVMFVFVVSRAVNFALPLPVRYCRVITCDFANV